MENYKLQSYGVLRIDTGENIPNSPSNREWQRYLAWLEEGNEPLPQFTLEELKENRWNEAIKILSDKCSGGVIVNEKIVSSTQEIKSDMNSLIIEIDAGNISNDYYYFLNSDFSTSKLNEEELRKAHYYQVKLYSLCNENGKLLKDLIDAAEDPYTVDIYQGWPITPYTEDSQKKVKK